MAICFAWTSAQLALIQTYLDDKVPYRAAAAEIQSKHKLKVTHNVIAGLVKRGTLRLHPDMVSAHGGRVTVAEMKRRLTLIINAYHNGDVTGPAIANSTGLSVNFIWRAARKLEIELGGRALNRGREPGHRRQGSRKRSRTKKQPREYIADPVSSIGVHFLDKRANHCNYVIAKDPKDGLARYCGEHRLMRGKYFASAYCGEHHMVCHRIEYMEAAE